MISTHRHSITRRGACQFAGPFRGKYGAALPHTSPLTARTERAPQKTERKKSFQTVDLKGFLMLWEKLSSAAVS